MTIRKKIEEYDNHFHKLLNSVNENYSYNENDYIQLNEILNFIKKSTEKMKNIFQILKFKSQKEILKLLKKSIPLTIHSVELKSFNNFTSKLLNGTQNDLLSFIKLLQFNDFLKLKIDDSTQSMFKELSDNLNYLFQFTNEKPSCENFKCNWLEDSQEIKNIIYDLYDSTSSLLNKDGNNFEKFKTNKLINVTPVTKDFSKDFISLYNLYKNEYDLESLKNNNQSKYYCKEVVYKVFSHVKEIHYQEIEKYIDIDEKDVEVTIYETEEYEEPEYRVRDIEKKIGNHIEIEKIQYIMYIKKTRQVPIRKLEKQKIERIKERLVKKTKFEDIYNEVLIKEFDRKLFNFDKQENEIEISKLRKIILDSLNYYKNGKSYGSCKTIKCKDNIEEKYKDLKKIWQEVEYLQYFEKYPNNILDG